MAVYNQQVKDKANQIKADANRVWNIVSDLQRLGSDFKAASVTARITEVRTLAKKYGYNLSTWIGEDEPIVELVVEPEPEV